MCAGSSGFRTESFYRQTGRLLGVAGMQPAYEPDSPSDEVGMLSERASQRAPGEHKGVTHPRNTQLEQPLSLGESAGGDDSNFRRGEARVPNRFGDQGGIERAPALRKDPALAFH